MDEDHTRSAWPPHSYDNIYYIKECYESVMRSSQMVDQTRLPPALRHKVHHMYEIMQSLTIAGVSLDGEPGYDRHPTVLRGLDLEFIHYVLILLPFSSLTCVLNST